MILTIITYYAYMSHGSQSVFHILDIGRSFDTFKNTRVVFGAGSCVARYLLNHSP